MKLLSGTKEDYDNLIISRNRLWSAQFCYRTGGTSWIRLLSNSLQSMTIDDYVCDGTNITMGCVAGSKATVSLIGVTADFARSLKEGAIVRVELRLTEYASTSDVTLVTPVYVIAESKKVRRSTSRYNLSLTLYDLSYLMTKSCTQSNALTALQAVTNIANKYGLTVNSSVSDVVSEIDGSAPHLFEPLDEELTDKQMLGYLAGYYGCYAEINEDEEICFSWFTPSDEVIAPDRIFDGGAYVTEMKERKIALLESGTSDTPLVAPSDASGFSINFENPYMTDEQLNAVYNARIAGNAVSFRIGKIHYKGNPLNNPGTIVTVKDIGNDTASFYIMKRTLTYDGGLSETIECLGDSETTLNHGNTSPLQKRISRSLSRMENAIKNATDVITQTKDSIFELIPVDDSDPTKGNSGWKLYSTEIGSNNVILANSSGIGFSSNGGQSYNAAAIYIDKNGTGHINADFIDVGQISADVIDTSKLVISQNNVEGLANLISEIDEKADTASTNASAAKTTANSAASKAASALSTASSAQSAADTANTVIGQWCYENDTTYIDGGNIYTGSVTADKIAANAITADKIAAKAITVDKLVVGDLTNYCRVNSVSYEAYDFMKLKESTIDVWPTDIDTSWLVPKYYRTSYYLSDWVDFAYNKDGDDKFLVQGSFYNKRSSGTVYLDVGVTLDDGSVYAFNRGTSDKDIYFSGSGVFNFNKTLTLPREYNGHRVVKIRPELYFSVAPTATYWFAINDITFRRASAGDITAGKLRSVDGCTYFDLDNSKIVADNSSGYSTALTAGGIVSHYTSGETDIDSGGLQPLTVNISNKDVTTQNLWFTKCLQIGSGKPTSNDPYFRLSDGSTSVLKPMIFMAGSGGMTFYDTNANETTLSMVLGSGFSPHLRVGARILEVYRSGGNPALRFSNGSYTADIYLADGHLYINDVDGLRRL